MPLVAAYAINTFLCLIFTVTMLPMSADLHDHGAPDGVVMVPFVLASIAFLAMLVFLYKVLRSISKH